MKQVEQIAQRIRELRGIMDIPKEKIADVIGVDVAEYEAYESGGTDISVGKLYAIAGALDVDPTVLLTGEAPRMVDYTIVRQGRGVAVQRHPGYRFTNLAYNFVGRQMEPMIVSLDPADSRPELLRHDGQEFNYVLEGTVAVTLGDREHILEAGDSIYFNPRIPHGQHAVGDRPAKFMTIINEIAIEK